MAMGLRPWSVLESNKVQTGNLLKCYLVVIGCELWHDAAEARDPDLDFYHSTPQWQTLFGDQAI